MTALPWLPRFDYGSGPTTWSATVPMRYWDKITRQTGGGDRAATGLGATYEIQNHYLIKLTIRYHETEENALFAAINYMRSWPQTGTWYPDKLVTGTSYTVDVESPKKGEDLAGRRDDQYPEVREIDVILRNVGGTAWPMNWFS